MVLGPEVGRPRITRTASQAKACASSMSPFRPTASTGSTSQVLAESGSLVLTLHSRRGGLESLQGHRLAISVTAPPTYLLLETGDRLLLEDSGSLLLEA